MFSYGFYNSQDGDRKYNATHFGKIFDGIIQDGVFGAAPEPLNKMFSIEPKETPDLTVTMNPGKAWLMHTWNVLDAKTTITFNQVPANYKRTDVVVLEVNSNYDETGFTPRTNGIKVIEGSNVSMSSAQSLPVLTQIWNSTNNERRIWQYPIAYITIYGSDYTSGSISYTANVINVQNIENRVNVVNGTDATKYVTWIPLVTGSTMNTNLQDYLPDWNGLFNQMMKLDSATFNTWFDELHNTIVIDESAQAALTQLNDKIDNKVLYGTDGPPTTLESGQIYFQIEV